MYIGGSGKALALPVITTGCGVLGHTTCRVLVVLSTFPVARGSNLRYNCLSAFRDTNMVNSLSCSISSSSVKSSPSPLYPSTPYCKGISELPSATTERTRLSSGTQLEITPLSIHLSHGLAYTTGSALGSHPPTSEQCLSAFTLLNQVGLTAGARAWTKHSHRSLPAPTSDSESQSASAGWWGTPSGPVATINERALSLFWKVMNGATWRNLHWLPHQVLVYEVRVAEGYGMRWSQNQLDMDPDQRNDINSDALGGSPWILRGFVEPMMENGHEVGWRHGL